MLLDLLLQVSISQSETIKQLYDQIDFRVFRFGERIDSQLASREESKNV